VSRVLIVDDEPAIESLVSMCLDELDVEVLIAAGLGEKCHEWAELARTIHGSCMLVLQGQGGGSWKLDFAGSPPTVTTDAGPADCSLSMSVADFVEMLAGGSHPAAALWDSKVIAGGDFTMARQVGQLLYLVTRGKAS